MTTSMVTVSSQQIVHHQLRVPRTDNALLVAPEWNLLPEILLQNEQKLDQADLILLGKPFQQLRSEAKTSLVAAANRYLERAGFGSRYADPACPIILSGHQPSLFHPGVWIKNFAISKIAELTSGTALNLIIDNDSSSDAEYSVPVQTESGLQTQLVQLDELSSAQPWEELAIQDQQLFASFAQRVTDLLGQCKVLPALNTGWADAVRRGKETNNLAEGVSAARIKVEREWGVENLELPIGCLSLEKPFLWFALHLMANLEQFQEIYNSALAEHRKRNGIRNQQHPVPDLQVDGEWLEAPFWIWKEGDEQRRHTWVKYRDGVLSISCGKKTSCELQLADDADAESAVEAFQQLNAKGIRFRPRALTTTLFSRLFLCELFVHGIGGAKYDEVTDEIISQFYHVQTPQYLALSGTIFLPTGTAHEVTQEEILQLQTLLRELKQQPARHLSCQHQTEFSDMLAERERLLIEQAEFKKLPKAEKKTLSEQNSQRFQRLKQINDQLTQATVEQQARISEEIERLKSAWDQKQIAENREYAAMFYPAEKMKSLISQCTNDIENAFAQA